MDARLAKVAAAVKVYDLYDYAYVGGQGRGQRCEREY